MTSERSSSSTCWRRNEIGRGDKIEQLRKRVLELAKDVTGKDPFGQGAVTDVDRALSPVSKVYQSLTETDVNLEVLKAEIQALHDAPSLAPDRGSAPGLLDLEISNRADVRQLEARIAAIDEKIADVKNESRKKIGETWKSDPAYARLEQESAQAKAELAELQASARKELSELRAQQQTAEQEQLIATKTQELASLNKKRALLAERFEKELQELRSGGAQSVELEFSKTELEREEKVFELIAARKLALQTESNAPTRVSLKQVATVPVLAIDPIPYKMLIPGLPGVTRVPPGVGRRQRIARPTHYERGTTYEGVALAGAGRGVSISRPACRRQAAVVAASSTTRDVCICRVDRQPAHESDVVRKPRHQWSATSDRHLQRRERGRQDQRRGLFGQQYRRSDQAANVGDGCRPQVAGYRGFLWRADASRCRGSLRLGRHHCGGNSSCRQEQFLRASSRQTPRESAPYFA